MRMLIVLLSLCAVAGAQDRFWRDEELAAVDDALDLLNMTRADAGFDKLVIDDEWRLPVVERTLSHPLEAADVAWGWRATARGTPSTILVAAARELGLQLASTDPAVLDWLSDAERRLATPELTETEATHLRRWAYAALVDESTHDGFVAKPEGEEDPKEMLALAAKVDRGRAMVAALQLLAIADRIVADPSCAEALGAVVAGEGDDVHDLRVDPPAILVDLGGNDRYLAPARATPDHPVAIVIDLGGNDVYGDGESVSCGAGFFGVGILWDHGDGDDTYHSGHVSQGCGLFGTGVLIDEGGSDEYRCRDAGQGAGAWGVGLLLDRGEGNDTFHADIFGQGFAYVGGLGLLHDAAGNDVYDAGGVHKHYPLFNDRYQSLSQGFSIGMRPHASGGVGLLVDDSGNDRYLCDIYGQGAAYWFSYGALIDSDGNDTYNLGQYGQGGGIHLATGCLIDLKGQDLYYDMHGVGTGGAHDFAVGLLVDREGDDYYAGSGGTMGGALTNSFALLLDAAGNDGYSAVKGDFVEGGGRPARGMGSIGLLVDLGGLDMHGTREFNDSARTKEEYGAQVDRPAPPAEEGAPPPRPSLTPDQVEARLKADAWDDARAAWDLDRLWDVGCQWSVGEMADVVPIARERLVGLGAPALEKALGKVGTDYSLEWLCVEDVLKRFGEQAVPRLRALLTGGTARERARAASLLADLKVVDAIDDVVALLGDPEACRPALDALARFGEARVWPAVADCLVSPVERTRVTAVRCLESLRATEAVPRLVERLAPPEMFTVRFAAEDVLVAFAAREALRALALDAGASRTARRHALRALGRIGDAADADLLVVALEDPDRGVRWDAVGALGTMGARDALAAHAGRETDPDVRGRIARILADHGGAVAPAPR